MRLLPTSTGFTIDAADLGRLLERSSAEVQRLMREGAITSRSELGEGEDVGRSRLTFFDGDRQVRLIVTADGEVLKRSRIRLARSAGKTDTQGRRPVKKGRDMNQVDESWNRS